MQDREYIIAWKRRDGHGKPDKGSKRFSKQEAENMVREMNQDYPEVEHWAEEVQ